MKTAFLFSGQGSQYSGMGADFAEKYSSSAKIFECGSDILGYDVKKLMLEGTAEELAQTCVSQPAIFTMSLLALNAAKENGIGFDAVAGHSLGEYAAMVASEMLTMEQGFTAIKHRAAAMDKAAKANPGGMAAVIGAGTELIEKTCADITAEGGYVTPVNYNSLQQTVIAGTAESLELAAAKLKENGIRKVVKLAVSAAFHSKLMNGAAEEFKAAVADMKFAAPKVDFYANVYGAKLTDFSDMPSYLSTHICSPVRFVSELQAMQADGIEKYLELGPGKVLTGLVKKTLDGVIAANIENNETMDAALAL